MIGTRPIPFPKLDVDRLVAGRRGPLIAALIALLAALPGFFGTPVLDRDEARHAQATAQMLETRDFAEARFQEEARRGKPVGIYWLQSAAVAVTSSPEARAIQAYRIPSLLGAVLAAAACAWGAARFWGDRAGTIAGVILASTWLLSTEGFIAKTDAALCACVALAMAALSRLYAAARDGAPAGRRVKLLFWSALALGVLIKGPAAPVIIGLTLLTLGLWDRRWRWMGSLGWAWGPVLVVAAVGPWAAAVTVATDGAFWSTPSSGEPAFGPGVTEGRGGWPGYHLLRTPLLFFPAALLLPAALATAWTRRAETGVRFAVAWAGPAWLLFELAPTKLVNYPLPLYPALAWLGAAALTAVLPRWTRWTGAALAFAAALAVTAICTWLLTEYGDPSDELWATLAAGLALLSAFVGAFFLIARASRTAFTAAAALGALSHGVLAAALLPSLQPLLVSPRLVEALDASGLNPRSGVTPGPVALAGYAEPSAVFLLGTRTELGDGLAAARAVAEGRPAFVGSGEAVRFHAELARLGVRARGVAVVQGFNYSRGAPVRLTLYRREAS